MCDKHQFWPGRPLLLKWIQIPFSAEPSDPDLTFGKYNPPQKKPQRKKGIHFYDNCISEWTILDFKGVLTSFQMHSQRRDTEKHPVSSLLNHLVLQRFQPDFGLHLCNFRLQRISPDFHCCQRDSNQTKHFRSHYENESSLPKQSTYISFQWCQKILHECG